jgi:dolichol-phosphate mannosyltransferase
VYNSAAFIDKLFEAVDIEKNKNNWNLELLLVDDGSKDNSFDTIVHLAEKYPFTKAIKLSRNFGHQAAVRTGLAHCKGDYVAIIDDDMQDPPSLLPMFFNELDKGFDVAYGIRKKRKESFLKVMSYNFFYKLLRLLSDISIPIDSGDFCVMKRCVVDNMLLLEEKNPFLRGIRSWVGFKQVGVEYERHERIDGQSGYTIKKLFKIAFDGIFSFSSAPIKVITTLGFLGFAIAVIFSVYIVTKYFLWGIDSPGYVTITLFISFFGSLNLICMGIIGEYISKIYEESKNRPHAIISQSINL